MANNDTLYCYDIVIKDIGILYIHILFKFLYKWNYNYATTLLQRKSMVFTLQNNGFFLVKWWFLQYKNYVFCIALIAKLLSGATFLLLFLLLFFMSWLGL